MSTLKQHVHRDSCLHTHVLLALDLILSFPRIPGGLDKIDMDIFASAGGSRGSVHN
jgi:hypothetical protein